MQSTPPINKTLSKLIIYGLKLLLGYLKNLPLTFLIVDIFVIVLMATSNPPLQESFFRLIAFTLKRGGSDVVFSAKDIFTFFAIWTIPVTILTGLLGKIVKIRINIFVFFGLIAFVLLLLHGFAAVLLNSFFVSAMFFVSSIFALILFFFLSSVEKILSRTEKLFK